MKALKYINLLLVLMSTICVYPQQYNIIYQQCFGGSDGESARDIIMLPDSSFVIIGVTNSNDGDVSNNHGNEDFWLVKINKDGMLIWEKTYGGSDVDSPHKLEVTSNNQYILFGETQSNDGDISNNHGGIDYWIVKVDDLGNIIWEKCLGSSVNDYASDMSIDEHGNIYVIGASHGTDGNISSPNGFIDYWIVKLDNNGKVIWENCLGGKNADWGSSILHTSDGGYLAGGYTTSRDGDVSCNNTSNTQSDIWIVKLDQQNNIQWQQCYGGSYNENALDIAATIDGGYIISCITDSDDGDVSGFHGNAGSANDIWIIKVDSLGNIEWENCVGGSRDEGRPEISLLNNEKIILNGYTESNDGDVTGNHSNSNFADIWIVELDFEGEMLWQQCFGSSYGEASSGICVFNDSELMVAGLAGKSDGSVDCDLYHPDPPLDTDFWIFRIEKSDTTLIPEIESNLLITQVYPNPCKTLLTIMLKPDISRSIISVSNIFGEQINSIEIPYLQNELKLDIARYPTGIYVCTIISDNEILDRKKFIKW